MIWAMNFLIVLWYLICVHVSASQEELGTNLSFSKSAAYPSSNPKKWLAEIISETEVNFDMDVHTVSRKCKEDFRIYKQHVRNQTVWAIRMMESSEWPKVGLFSGVTVHLGNYAECLRSRGPGISGQYCIAQANYNLTTAISYTFVSGWNQWPKENASVWRIMKMYERNPFRKSRRSLTWALCIPASCTSDDLQTALNRALYPVFKEQKMDVAARVDPVLCKTEEDSLLAKYFNPTTICLCGLLILIVVLSSLYDLIFGINQVFIQSSLKVKIVKCFSAVQNYKSLIEYYPAETYPLLHFLKVIFTCIVLWGHATILYYTFPKFETEEMEMSYQPWNLELIGPVLLNGFFLISGFLRAFNFNYSPEAESSTWFFTRSLALKWFRMIPAHGLVILFFLSIIPLLEEGPFSNHILKNEVTYCTSNWWTNMLAIQNIVNYREMCSIQSWYIAVDIQLFIIGTVLLINLRKNKKIGVYLITLTFLYSVTHSFIRIYVNASHNIFTEIFTVDVMNYRDSFMKFFFFHTMTFYRVGPYLVGFITAFITKFLLEKGYKFTRAQTAFWIFSSCIIGFGYQLYEFTFFIAGRETNPAEIAAYSILQQILQTLPFAVLICIHFVSGLGILESFFEIKVLTPLGRLSFSVFLVGIGVQTYHIFSQRKALPRFSRMELYWWIIGDIFFVLILAFLCFIFCEAPVNSISNLFIRPYLFKSSRKNKLHGKITKVDTRQMTDP